MHGGIGSKEAIVRPSIWWAAALCTVFILAGCNSQNSEAPPPKQEAAQPAESTGKMPEGHPPISMKIPEGHPAVGESQPSVEEGPTISGTISLAPGLADKISPDAVLYVIARQEGLNAPVAVARLQGVTFPVDYALSRQHMMGSADPSAGGLNVTARLDKDGFVGPPQPGDIEGAYTTKPVSMGDKDINFTLDKLVE